MLVVLLSFPAVFFAQSHDLLIGDYLEKNTYLDDEIMGDSTAFGTRKDPDRVYVLKKDGIYLVKSNIKNVGWLLRLKGATDGTGQKPIVMLTRNPATNAYPGQMFLPQGDIVVKNIIFINYPELLQPNEISSMPGLMFNFSSVGFSGEFVGCVFTESRQVLIQINAGTRTVKFRDCVFSNGGCMLNTNQGNGRAIDCRGTSCDSLIIQNCTITNMIDRAVRHYNSTAVINNFVMDHCTITNGLSYHGNIALGWTGKSAVIYNNLFVDNFVLGNDSTDDVRLTEFVDSKEYDVNGNVRMCMVNSFPNDSTKWYVTKNYYAVTAPVQAFYDQHSNIGLGNLNPVTRHINKRITVAGLDSTKAFTKLSSISLVKNPTVPVKFTTWYWDPALGNKKKGQTGWDQKYDLDRHSATYYVDTLNLAYETTNVAYTGASAGLPAGDLNWFPSKKAEWEALKGNNLVSVETQAVPTSFTLEQNYPNPFNPTTVIAYSVPQASNVKLEVYDILGRLVTTLVNEVKQVGNYKVDFNASKLSTGVYVYRLSSQNQVISKKMMLIK